MKSILSLFLLSLVLFASCSSDDGSDAPGFEGANKLGSITLTFKGKRPDGEEFTAKKIFSYATGESSSSTAVGDLMEHDITRYNYSKAEYATIYIPADEEPEPEFYVETYIVEGTELFYLNIEESIDTDPIKLDYNDDNGKLTYTFDFVVPAGENSTGYDLTVSGEANVTTLQNINTNN